MKTGNTTGYIVVTTLVFSGVFTLILYSLLGFVFSQTELQRQDHRRIEVLQIAESGLDWYRWYLSHNPDDIDGPTDEMPYEKEITDPERGVIGTAEITAEGATYCGQTQTVDITATGASAEEPGITRTVSARYSQPSVAEFSFILNSNVWAGDDRVISGPYHSNGGVRMDSENNSPVTSARENWTCTGSFGCNYNQTRPGVFGNGSGDELWDSPVPPVDFSGITLDLAELNQLAQADGLYFSSDTPASQERGWRLALTGDSVNVFRVTGTDNVAAFNNDDGRHYNPHVIDDETYLGNYPIPENCPIVFVDGKVWLEGEVSEKVTVAAADVENPNFDPDIVLADNITYSTENAGLTAVAERDVSIPLLSPDTMQLNGIFIAQNGRFGRDDYYLQGDAYDRRCGLFRYCEGLIPDAWQPYINRDKLSISGSVISNGRVGTQWSSGNTQISGYSERESSYDADQAVFPPPLTPTISEEYEFISWQELESGE